MSRKNGDGSRFSRLRKARVHARACVRALLELLRTRWTLHRAEVRVGAGMSSLVRYGPSLEEHRSHPLAAGIAWTVSYAWIALKDASWLSVIGLICIATFAVSAVVMKHGRADDGARRV
jgi:hypothetical protein